MSLPFLQDKKRMVAIIMGKRHDDGSVEVGNPDGSPMDGIMSAAADLMKAIHAKDVKMVAEALKSAFEILDEDEPEEMKEEES